MYGLDLGGENNGEERNGAEAQNAEGVKWMEGSTHSAEVNRSSRGNKRLECAAHLRPQP